MSVPNDTMPVRSLGLWHAARTGDCESISSLLGLGDSINRENAVRVCGVRDTASAIDPLYQPCPCHAATLGGRARLVTADVTV